ncbi:MAG TPA: serine/threonine-protein kinase [Pyrinomonadaceae bacterium]|nr:serine/threonine-protein kinase [Pyrinomonadaceae bacterium]
MESSSKPDTPTRRRTRPGPMAPGAILQERYSIVRELGSGGMGAVYEAIDERLGATVAIKETFSIDERLRRHFEQEARLLARLHHAALPRVSDYFTEDGRAFLVMQFISGDDLAQVIAERHEAFPPQQVIAWADQLLDALIYLHTRDRQIVHRDIKPHNLKVTESGQIALLDFGLAKTHAGEHSTTQSSHSLFGYTRRYSPIEQMQDQGTSPQSDIYALGATLYHLLTGEKPADALVRAAALANGKDDLLEPADKLNPAVEVQLSEILTRAMALNAADRFADAREFREALRLLGRNLVGTAEVVSKPTEALELPLTASSIKRVDPFDSYSILKPEDEVFRLPKRTRGSAVAFVAVALVLITAVASFPSNLLSSIGRFFDDSFPRSSRQTTSAAALKQGKTEAVVIKPAPLRNSDATGSASLGNSTHANEPPKKRQRRNVAKASDPKPPAFSITPN